MVSHPENLTEMIEQTRTYLNTIDLDTINRKHHEKILFDITMLFRGIRTFKAKSLKKNSWRKLE